MEINRRDFFKVVGIGGTAAAMVGCGTEPPETLVPYLIPPEEIVPGRATWYATVCRECPAGCGVLAKTVEGRVIKVEGNPDHPASRGGLCARGQASLQGLYNPDRIRQPHRRKADGSLEAIPWEEGERVLAEHLAALKGQGGRIAFVTPLLTGSLDRLIESWLGAVGGRRVRYEAVAHEAHRTAGRLAFGLEAIPFYDLEPARVVLSFGADFLETWLSPVEHARQFAAARAYRQGRIGRFAYIGPRLSLTGANADEWIAARPGTEGLLALGMLHTILAERLAPPLPGAEEEALARLAAPFTPAAVAERADVSGDKVRVLARAFARLRPSLALADGRGTGGTATCLAVHLLNYVVGNLGQTVRFGPTAAAGRTSAYREGHGGWEDLAPPPQRGQPPLHPPGGGALPGGGPESPPGGEFRVLPRRDGGCGPPDPAGAHLPRGVGRSRAVGRGPRPPAAGHAAPLRHPEPGGRPPGGGEAPRDGEGLPLG
ncbi:MAG: molybdopterin-dependent oxidoreductase [candidate division NC10 bacterium]|nr:molybdopterin-dependent oxidoreductase [candidate division NC10 bacterium]